MEKLNLTYEDVVGICEANESFKMKHQTFGDTQVAMCTYFLASAGDFFDAKNDGSLLNALELRGITFTKFKNEDWKRYLFISKFMNVGQTNGTNITNMALEINGKEQICNINKLYATENADKVYRALDLKIGMVVGEFDRRDETVGELFKVETLSKEELATLRPENSWMYNDVKDLTIDRVANKDDGSAIRFLILNGELVAKTKFSLEAEQTEMAMTVVNANPDLKAFILKTLELGLAALFEIVSPHNKIVLAYNYTTLKLLQLRDEETAEYLNIYTHDLVKEYNILTADQEDLSKIKRVAEMYSVKEATEKLGDTKFTSLEDFLDFLDLDTYRENQNHMFELDIILMAKDYVEEKEGWVVTFSNGKMAKIKTDWYMNLHSILEDGLKEHKIITRIIDETIDDVIAQIPEENTEERAFIDDITLVITKHINHIASDAEKKFKAVWTGDKKEIAMAYKADKQAFPYIMNFAKGRSYEEVEAAVAGRVQFECRKLEMAKKYLRNLGFTNELKLLEDDE